WGAIVGSSLWLARRKSPGKALAFMAIAFTFLRLRDASSAVMPEALAVALLLPLTAAFLAPPRRLTAFSLLGLSTALLFYIRPNCGAAMLLLGIAALLADRRGRPLLAFAAGFAVLVVPLRSPRVRRLATILSTASDTRFSRRAPITTGPHPSE